MAAYKSIVGQKIKKVTSDPSNPIEGQMWYNSSTGKLKVRLTVAAAFGAEDHELPSYSCESFANGFGAGDPSLPIVLI